MITTLRSLPAQRVFIAALLLFFVGVSIQYSAKAAKGRSAINRWAPQIQQLETGDDIHKQFNYPNPPIMAVLLWPISELVTIHPLLGALVWFYIKVAMAAYCLLAVFRLIETLEKPFPAWAKLLTVVLSIRPILGDLTHGNVNIFILFLVVASLSNFSKGRDLRAGLFLALAIACKVTPALFAAYFVWKRAGRVLAGTGIGLVAFFFVVPAIFLGWDTNLRALTSWIEVMILPFITGNVITSEHNNQSLPGVVTRLLTAAPSFSTYINGQYVPLRYDNIASLSPTMAGLITKAAMVMFGLLVVLTCRTPTRVKGMPAIVTRRGWRLAAEYSLICIGMLIFSERTWKHHCVTLLLPFAVLCYGFSSVDWSRGTRRIVGMCLVLATVLMYTTSTGLYGENPGKTSDVIESASLLIGPAGIAAAGQAGVFSSSWGKMAQAYGAYLWAFGTLIIGLTVQMLRTRTSAIPTVPEWKLPAYSLLYPDRRELEVVENQARR